MMDKNFSPPPGFVPVESKLAGITVFAPAPEIDSTPETTEFKCPQCGATTAFDPAITGVVCQHCGFAEETATQNVGRSAPEQEFTLENLSLAQRGWGEERQEIHCESCGADLSVDAGHLSSTCPFCASNRVVARVATQDKLRPRHLIPFKIESSDLQARVKTWLGKGWMHPSDLSRSAGSTNFQGVYLPFWTFDATIYAKWRAEVGYERKERYYDHGSKSWKTRTKIDWRWESGQVSQSPDDWLGVGTTKISQILLKRLYPYHLQGLVAYQPDFLAGWQALNYDIQLQTAWERIKNQMSDHTRQVCHDQIRSHRVRNFSMVADFEDETWRYILLPVYAAAYRFDGETYQVLINGQTGAVAGQKPIEWWKVWLAIGGLLTPGVLLALLGLVLLVFGGIGIFPLGLGGILFVVGVVISISLFKQAVEAGEA